MKRKALVQACLVSFCVGVFIVADNIMEYVKIKKIKSQKKLEEIWNIIKDSKIIGGYVSNNIGKSTLEESFTKFNLKKIFKLEDED